MSVEVSKDRKDKVKLFEKLVLSSGPVISIFQLRVTSALAWEMELTFVFVDVYYRPQEKVMFSDASVSHSGGGQTPNRKNLSL